MLLSFRVANHCSIRDEQQLALMPVYPDDASGKEAAVPVAALFGPNAAGKSNVVGALAWMQNFVLRSHLEAEPGEGVPRTPFLLDAVSAEEPSWYVTDLLLDGVRHTYGFRLDSEQVIEEWLYTYPLGRRRKVFERTGRDIEFGENEPRGQLSLLNEVTEPNVLYLSIAARSNQESVLPVYRWFKKGVRFISGRGPIHPRATLKMLESGDYARVVRLLQDADLGIQGVQVEDASEYDLEPASWSQPMSLSTAVRRARAREDRKRVSFLHKGSAGSYPIPLAAQSAGTQALFAYAAPLLTALDEGTLFVVDEIDASLHPVLTARLIGLFQSPAANPRGAQLLLTTHDVTLLGRSGGEDILKRDQIWFADKDDSGATEIFALSEFKPRKDENRERRYLGGSYGAVPFISEERLAEIATSGRGAGNDGA